MKLLIASDHAGFELKQHVVQALQSQTNFTIQDFGTTSLDSVDYPDFADQVCKSLKSETTAAALTEMGILICGSGQGMALRANKYPHIRAALVYSEEITRLSREHNDANIICMGSRFCTLEQALHWIQIFSDTNFAQGRHQNRVIKLAAKVSC